MEHEFVCLNCGFEFKEKPSMYLICPKCGHFYCRDITLRGRYESDVYYQRPPTEEPEHTDA